VTLDITGFWTFMVWRSCWEGGGHQQIQILISILSQVLLREGNSSAYLDPHHTDNGGLFLEKLRNSFGPVRTTTPPPSPPPIYCLSHCIHDRGSEMDLWAATRKYYLCVVSTASSCKNKLPEWWFYTWCREELQKEVWLYWSQWENDLIYYLSKHCKHEFMVSSL